MCCAFILVFDGPNKTVEPLIGDLNNFKLKAPFSRFDAFFFRIVIPLQNENQRRLFYIYFPIKATKIMLQHAHALTLVSRHVQTANFGYA